MLNNGLRIRRALITVSDKAGIEELAKELAHAGAELVATGRTAKVLEEAGLKVVPIERVSGSPEAFQGRMKTLSFPVCSGILYRRGDSSDEADLKKLSIQPIDCVVVNFYPFEQAAARPGVSRPQLVEEIDIGGPTLVRAAAKNAPDVLVLTDPAQYHEVISELKRERTISHSVIERCTARAWERIKEYDLAIASEFGEKRKRHLRYGENPHQKGHLEFDPNGPIDWSTQLTPTELSYNNILDLSSAYALASDLREIDPRCSSAVIVKHNNPCGVAMLPRGEQAQLAALKMAWDGDPVSAFGGVIVLTDPLEEETARWLSERFIELIAAPGLTPESAPLKTMLSKRKNLKAVSIRVFGGSPPQSAVAVPGGILYQSTDLGTSETLRCVTRKPWPRDYEKLSRFGIAVCRTLKSNAIALVREIDGGSQLVGAGQGQPNRIEALQALAVPRAKKVIGEDLSRCLMVSDAFFPFRDTVDASFAAGIRAIIQPGGSLKDAESIAACDEHGMTMAFTGTRHFKH